MTLPFSSIGMGLFALAPLYSVTSSLLLKRLVQCIYAMGKRRVSVTYYGLVPR